MGTGHRINKRTSHLNILLGEKVAVVKKSKVKKPAFAKASAGKK